MWFAYGPHWSVLPTAGSDAAHRNLTAQQETWLKRSTALSWELREEEKCHIPSGLTLQAASVAPVADPVELQRHSGSPEHLEVLLTPRAEESLASLRGRWLFYAPHWRQEEKEGRGCWFALQDTWLKRSWHRSSTLQEPQKLAMAAGECLEGEAFALPPPPDANSAEELGFAADHRELRLRAREVVELRRREPRLPLCKYFSGNREVLLEDLRRCFADRTWGPGIDLSKVAPAEPAAGAPNPLALLLPHGGYCNSGFVAAHGFALLAQRPLSLAVVVGNNHASWHRAALCDQTWHTPLGTVEPASASLLELRERVGCCVDRAVHAQEHSIENQLPFLQLLHPHAQIVPLGVGAVSLEEAVRLAEEVARLVRGAGEGRAVLLGTTDFSHEGPSYGGPALPMAELTELTRSKDEPLLDAVLRMDAQRLLELGKGSSMCGAGAAAVLLLACGELGFTKSRLLRYLVNTEVTPCGSTTGFASFAFEPP